MRLPTRAPDDFDLELPALDGGEDSAPELSVADALEELGAESSDALDDTPFDDAPFGDASFGDVGAEGAESGWLDDAESVSTLDVGPFDLTIEDEDVAVVDEGESTDGLGFDPLISEADVLVADAGEEGPLDGDEELREADLPALDADDDGDVPDEALFDGQLFGLEDEPRWDDRAWARLPELANEATGDEFDDSGVAASPGDDPSEGARDEAWRRLEETGRVMATERLPGGAVVLAVASPDRTRGQIVRIWPDGQARIVAEVEPRAAGDGEACVVTFLRWDPARGCLFVGGSFGVEAYRPV